MSSYLSFQFKFRTTRFLTYRFLLYKCHLLSTPMILVLKDTEDGGILDKVVSHLLYPTLCTQQSQNNKTNAPARKRIKKVLSEHMVVTYCSSILITFN